jgi:ribosome-binding protein aMBF1 (putative translation factor)
MPVSKLAALTPEQGRMARAALSWSAKDLAAKAEVSVNTVINFETGHPVRDSTVFRLKAAFEGHGVTFGDRSVAL